MQGNIPERRNFISKEEDINTHDSPEFNKTEQLLVASYPSPTIYIINTILYVYIYIYIFVKVKLSKDQEWNRSKKQTYQEANRSKKQTYQESRIQTYLKNQTMKSINR